MSAIRVERKAVSAKSRLVHLSLLSLNLRLMENWRSLQIAMKGEALDYESTMILMAIIVISADKWLRTDLDPELENLERPLPQECMSKANVSSIAAATGINRETVRRRVNELQDLRLVVRERRGVRMGDTGVQRETVQGIIRAQLDSVVRTVNQLAKLDVLSITH